MILESLSDEISVTTANTVDNAILVRINATKAAKVTVSSGDDKRTFTMAANTSEIVPKDTTDTIASNTAILCASVAYSV